MLLEPVIGYPLLYWSPKALQCFLPYKGKAGSAGQGWVGIGVRGSPAQSLQYVLHLVALKPSHSSSLQPTGSTKDLMETCCAAGQQWAIDNDECQEIPENGAQTDVCR